MNKVLVRLDNISKKFNDKYIIKNLTLDVYEGEFLTLLGSSGRSRPNQKRSKHNFSKFCLISTYEHMG